MKKPGVRVERLDWPHRDHFGVCFYGMWRCLSAHQFEDFIVEMVAQLDDAAIDRITRKYNAARTRWVREWLSPIPVRDLRSIHRDQWDAS